MINRSSSFQCQRIFQVTAPVNCVCLHPNQAELIVGDQSGVIHLWDLRSDHNEQLVCYLFLKILKNFIFISESKIAKGFRSKILTLNFFNLNLNFFLLHIYIKYLRKKCYV